MIGDPPEDLDGDADSAPNPDGSFSTHDPEEAEAHLVSSGGAIAFSTGSGAGASAFRFDLEQGGDPRALIVNCSISGLWSSDGDFSVFHVGHVVRGSFAWDIDGSRGTGSEGPYLVGPGARMRAESDSIEAMGLYVEEDLVRRTARQLYCMDEIDLRFHSPRPIDAPHGEYLRRLMTFAEEARRTGAIDHDLVRAGIMQNLAVGVLECFPLVGDPEERHASQAAARHHYRMGVRYLEDNASLPITVADAAQALGISVGDLERTFASNAMMSPGAYLRRVRLSAAHEDLLAGDPSSASVPEIARRWGFASVGGFAHLYRRDYGSSPERTLES